MSDRPERAITRVLEAAGKGDRQASADLLPLVYDELHRLAQSKMAHESPGQTLQPTALVHEAYLRVLGSTDPGWDNRGHFFAAAAQAMRRILVEQARRKARLKHGGGRQRVDLEYVDIPFEPPAADVLAVHEALERLEADDARKGQIVNMRYFAGLTTDETAAALGMTPKAVEREWTYIWVWLQREPAASDSG